VSGDLGVALTSPPAAAAAEGGTVSVAFSVLEPTVCNILVNERWLRCVHMVEGMAGIPAS